MSTPPSSVQPGEFSCDRCGRKVRGKPAGAGLFVSARGEEVRYEEPPLCQSCADAAAAAGMRMRDFGHR